MSQAIRWSALGIVLLVMLTLVSAQSPSMYSVANPSSGLVQSNASQYSQFYQMISGPAPSTKISAPEQYDITGHTPNNVYLTMQNQAVPYSRYQANMNYSGNALWIQGTTDWAQYAVVPQGSIVPLIATSHLEGIGNLNFKDYDAQIYNYNFYFYPNNHLTFYADNPGRYIMSFVSGNKSSNAVVIDVTGTYTPPSNYLPTPMTYNSAYNPYSYNNPQAALDLADIARANQRLYNDYYSNSAYYWLNVP
jgi:hypothetical protein